MLRNALLFMGIFWLSLPLAAQNAEAEPSEETVTIAFNVPLKKKITLRSTTISENSTTRFEATETTVLTPIKKNKEGYIYKAKTTAAKLVSTKGIPPLLLATLERLGQEAVGMSFEYQTDGTGYPTALTKHKKVTRFMKKLTKKMRKWVKATAKKKNLNAEQANRLIAVVDQATQEFTNADTEALSRLVLEDGQLLFLPTGRRLFVNYDTSYDSSRYFAPVQAYFHTDDIWSLDSYDETTSKAEISFTQTLDTEEYAGFMERYRTLLIDKHGEGKLAAIEKELARYATLSLTRSGYYVVDLKTGFPLSGTITSKQTFNGKEEVDTFSFTAEF